VLDADVDLLEQSARQIALIDRHLPTARKVVEVLEETRAFIDDRRQRRVFMIARAVDARAEVEEGAVLLGKYANTRAYRSANALKAARTRRRNQQDAASADNGAVATPGEDHENTSDE
jgi:hypothetical protein